MVTELQKRLPIVAPSSAEEADTWMPPRVLVPGAGLGRLPYEVARKGYIAEGNEWSYYMLLGSDFILNRPADAPRFEIQPWVHHQSNVARRSDQLRVVAVPDVIPACAPPPPGSLSMCAGDFVEVYGKQAGEWDALLTCFFIDTAQNVIAYLETIATLLCEGGVWINLGPLLFHYEEMDDPSIELSLDDIYAVMETLGLEIVQKEEDVMCSYTSNCRSMMRTSYHCAFFTAIKRTKPTGAANAGQGS
jgi:carnosine N-methyltransferase